jgi:hypothetical protein
MNGILAVQALTYVALGTAFLMAGNWRLGITQLLLAVVQGLVYAS